MATPRICSIPDCGKPHNSRGWCLAHYQRWYRNGDPLGGRTVEGLIRKFITETAVPFTGSDCLPWPYSSRIVWGDGGGFKIPHRVVCQIAHGDSPTPEHEVAHSCGNGHIGCVNPAHIRWATRRENTLDKVGHGSLRLTPDDVRAIREMATSQMQKDIAARYRVDCALISLIVRRKRWGWIAD